MVCNSNFKAESKQHRRPLGPPAANCSTVTLDAYKQAAESLRLPELVDKLGRPFDPPTGRQMICCPFHGEQTGSFGFYADDLRFNCFGCGVEGDAADLVELLEGVTRPQAMRRVVDLAGGIDAPTIGPKVRRLKIPTDLKPADDALKRRVGALRRLDPLNIPGAPVLFSGTVQGAACYIVTDTARKAASARRLDGQPFPAAGNRKKPVKVLSLPGTDNGWPIGLVGSGPLHANFDPWRAVAVFEGCTDYLAAYHLFLENGIYDVLPLALVGQSKSLNENAWRRLRAFKGKRAFVYLDDDEAGRRLASERAKLLSSLGLDVIGIELDGLRRTDGRPVSDVNDLVVIAEGQRDKLTELLP